MLLYQHIESNKKKTIFLICIFFCILVLIGSTIGLILFDDLISGIVISSTLAIFYVFISIVNAEGTVLRMNHAKPISKEDNIFLYNTVENLSLVAKIPVPKLYIIKEDSPNAFAAGISPKKSSVCVTTALLEKLNREEIEAVLAHEIAHIANNDIMVSTISIGLLSVILILCDIGLRLRFDDSDDLPVPFLILGILFMLLAPLLGKVIHFAISRNREYLADATGAKFTRNPLALASALEKISSDPDIVDNISPSCAALYISDPLKKHFDTKGNKKKEKTNLFSTHPTTSSRIDRLKNM